MPSLACKTIAVLVVRLSLVAAAGRPSLCETWKSDIQRSEGAVRASRNYKGLWLSEKCEVVPGPQFVLRRYHFLRNGRFQLTRYYYSDPGCASAAFSVTVLGSFQPAPERATASSASWVVPGGLELDYALRKMTLVPFTAEEASLLARKVNRSCPGVVTAHWRPFRKYRVLDYGDHHVRNRMHTSKLGRVDDMDCTSSLGISFNELQLMRLEHRMPLRFMEDASARTRSYLYLGAEGTKPRNRPTYYQVPLLPAQTQSCPMCRMLSRASVALPPELPSAESHLLTPAEFNGHWISLRCEVRPYGLFLKREFVFSADSGHWSGRHEYFKDPQCKNPMFTLTAEGTFSLGQPSSEIPNALQCDFEISESAITPDDPQFASNLNGLPNCGSGSWRVGQTASLGSSGGCKELGIKVPSTELELVRLSARKPGVLLLQLGDGSEDQRRPTSFQFPLVQCSAQEVDAAQDHNLLFNDLRPLPLISGSPFFASFSTLFYPLAISCLFLLTIH